LNGGDVVERQTAGIVDEGGRPEPRPRALLLHFSPLLRAAELRLAVLDDVDTIHPRAPVQCNALHEN
jgi:hypothetical protein